jgi:hypothetical protein
MFSAICAFLRGCKNQRARQRQRDGIRAVYRKGEKAKKGGRRLVRALIMQVDDKFLKCDSFWRKI